MKKKSTKKTSGDFERQRGYKVFSGSMPADQYREFKALCAANGESVRSRIAKLVRAYLKREKRRAEAKRVGGKE